MLPRFPSVLHLEDFVFLSSSKYCFTKNMLLNSMPPIMTLKDELL